MQLKFEWNVTEERNDYYYYYYYSCLTEELDKGIIFTLPLLYHRT
jgi:hypothetical protein